MKLFDAFTKKAPNKVFVSMLFGAFSGICYALLIPLVVSSIDISRESFELEQAEAVTFLSLQVANHKFAAIFLVLCLAILTTRSLSQIILSRVSMDVTAQLRTQLYERIAAAPIAALEYIGAPKLVAILTTDVPRIVLGSRMLPDLVVNLVTLIGMLGFLLYLNINVFWFVMGAILAGIITFQIPVMFGNRYLAASRERFDHLQESIHGLIYGSKELKLNANKRKAYFNEVLLSHEQAILSLDKRGHTIMRVAENYGDLISFFVIGATAYIFVNYYAVKTGELIGTIMALLYITTPIAIILMAIPQIMMAKISLNKVANILAEIPREEVAEEILPARSWQSITFRQVSYQHRNADEQAGFTVGPLDLSIKKGQITFIVGGNGSGKSTLSKLITLHYLPKSGDIYFDKEVVSNLNVSTFRQDLSAIYSDYYLFDRVLGIQEDQQLQQRVDEYLKMLDLHHKVTFSGGKFSTLSLSDGQKRRLALLVSFIEDKQLYLFDEWAADQDPSFKTVFYQNLLLDLKAKNKAVVVISHDDRYFDLADQIIEMNEGKVAGIAATPSSIAEKVVKVAITRARTDS